MLFVVQKHHSKRPHYDFRLERDGVLKSWAIPKEIPALPGERRLAVQVEDHHLAFGEFEGVIPEGQYGAGRIEVWDRGTYETIRWDADGIIVVLYGTHLRGPYCLIPFRRAGDREWLIQRLRDVPHASGTAQGSQ